MAIGGALNAGKEIIFFGNTLRAEGAKEKKAALGPDIDLSRYTQHIERGKIESLESMTTHAKEAAIMTGISLTEEERAGSFMQVDQSVVYEHLNKSYEGQVEIMSTTDALETVRDAAGLNMESILTD